MTSCIAASPCPHGVRKSVRIRGRERPGAGRLTRGGKHLGRQVLVVERPIIGHTGSGCLPA